MMTSFAIPQTPSYSNIKDSKNMPEITLIPNLYQQSLRNRWRLLLIVALPLLGIYAGLVNGTNFELFERLIVITGVGTGLWMLYLHLRKNDQVNAIDLVIDKEEISIYENETLTQSFLNKELTFEMLGWGPDVDCLMPAVRMITKENEIITIGLLSETEKWKDYKRSVQATDYIIEAEDDWNQIKAFAQKH